MGKYVYHKHAYVTYIAKQEQEGTTTTTATATLDGKTIATATTTAAEKITTTLPATNNNNTTPVTTTETTPITNQSLNEMTRLKGNLQKAEIKYLKWYMSLLDSKESYITKMKRVIRHVYELEECVIEATKTALTNFG